MYIKQCAVCGRDFEAKKGNVVYCSDACRVEGRKLTRSEWIERTGYNEKRRHAMALYRAQQTEEEYQRERKKEKNRLKALKRKRTIEHNKREEALLERAAAGDPYARLTIASRERGNTSGEFWEAYKDYVLDNDTRSETKTSLKRYVNNISVLDPDFAVKVVASIIEKQSITSVLL